MSTMSRPRTITGLVLPADPEQPPRRLTIDGAQDLSAVVRGELEGIRSTAHRHLQAFIAAGENRKGRPLNEAANRVMRPGCPDDARIVGNVVLVGYDTRARSACDLSDEQQRRITGQGPIHYPDRREVRSDRHLTYSWDLAPLPDGRMLQASLNVRYHDPLQPRDAGCFVSYLTNEAVTVGADGGRALQGMWFGTCKTQSAQRFTKRARDQFAAWMLDRVRGAFLLPDSPVKGMFRAP